MTSVTLRKAFSRPIKGMVAHIQPEHLFLEREPLALVELEVRDGHPGAVEAGRRGAPAAASSASSSKSEKRVEIPCSCSRRLTSARSTIPSKARQSPFRGWPSESKAPALASDSTARLLSALGSTRRQKS